MAWTNTGGGDHNGADWTPGNGETIGGTHTNIGSFTITSGYTVDISQGSDLKIFADDIDVDGTLNGNGKGYAAGSSKLSGTGPGGGVGNNSTGAGAGGGGYGGAGGQGGDSGAGGGSSYGSSSDSIIQMGSGGGGSYNRPGGNGGGSVLLNACTVDIDGTINCNGLLGGSASVTGGGGGAGGGICILCKTLVCTTATMTCNGAAGGSASSGGGGGGGGGRAKFFYYSTDVDPLTKTTVTNGPASGGTEPGAAGTIGTENGYPTMGRSYTSHVPGQVINFGISGVVHLTKIDLNAGVMTASGDHTLTIYESPSKITNYGSKTITISGTGDQTFEFASTILLPDGMLDYYFEVVRTSGDCAFNYAGNNEYGQGDMYHNDVLLDGLDLYMKVYTYPHVIKPSVYNVSDRSMKCNVAGIVLTGASHRINADGSGHIDYDDEFTTAKYAGDLAGLSGVTYDDPNNELDIAAGGYIYYKLDTKYPVFGIPTLTSQIDTTAGTPTIQIAEDINGEPAGWYNITDSIVDNVDTEYELDAEDLNLEGKTIIYFRFDCAGTATASLKSFNLNIDLDTSTAQIPAVDMGGSANTFRCDQDDTSSINSTITLYYNDAKLAG